MTKEELVIRGSEAEYLLNSPVLKQAFDDLEDKWVRLWKTSLATQDHDRETMYYMVNAANELKKQLLQYMNDAIVIKADSESSILE